MSEELDRRHEERAAIELRVEYQRLNAFFSDYTRNISKGGTFIKTIRPLAIGTVFVFRLYIPTQPEPLELRGEVRWVQGEGEPPREPGGPTDPGMGIRFVYDEDQQRAWVEKVVEAMMVSSLGPLICARLIELNRG